MTITPEHGPFPYQPCVWGPTARVARAEPLRPGARASIAGQGEAGGDPAQQLDKWWLLPDIEEINGWVLERAREAFRQQAPPPSS